MWSINNLYEKTLLIATAALVLSGIGADAKTSHYNKLMKIPSKAEGTLTYVPGCISSYYWSENEWMLSESADYTYDESNGRILSKQTDYSKTEYTYTPEGKYATIEEKMRNGEDWVLAQKRVFL